MANPEIPRLLQDLMSCALAPEEERAAVTKLLQQEPHLAPQLAQLFLHHKLRAEICLRELQVGHEALVEGLKGSPWKQAVFLELVSGTPDRAFLVLGSQRMLVGLSRDIDATALRRGQLVYVNDDENSLVHAGTPSPLPGSIGTFCAMVGTQALLQGPQQDYSLLDLADLELAGQLKPGDHVVYWPEGRLVLKPVTVPSASGLNLQLEDPPDVTFDQIGGLDAIIETLTQEIRLHVFHRDVVARHRLPFRKGILLYGPPGCGKTLLAKAVARYVSALEGVQGRFVDFKAGSHRSMWYGQTEERLRDLFDQVRRAATSGQFVTVLLDDFDHFGSRDGAAHAVDARILPALLHEVDALQSVPGVFLVGVTNRPDLLDEALLRPGRFGDRPFVVPRPDRAAAYSIFHVHLPKDVPCRDMQGSDCVVFEEMIDRILARVYAPNGDLATLGTLTFRDGSRTPLRTAQLMSGALIANVVIEAKRQSCLRALRGEGVGISLNDLNEAMVQELLGLAARLKPGAGLKQLLDLSSDLDVVRIDITATQRPEGRTAWLDTPAMPITA